MLNQIIVMTLSKKYELEIWYPTSFPSSCSHILLISLDIATFLLKDCVHTWQLAD